MEKTAFYQQIKAFFVRNFDLRQEKEDEQETIESIRRGVGPDFCDIHRLVRFKYQFDGGYYWCHVDLSFDGADHGLWLGIGNCRF